ncbi:MAG TPA: FecR domain-containing protein [Aquabacterium sp.]|nr:FecR domain-containing protein [Aquabacterium sp.]
MIRNRTVPSLRHLWRTGSLAWAAAGALMAAPAAATEQQAVGQVSLVIGAARVVHLNGSSEPLRRGASILVGDRVETSANGHVHVRFIDNGAVSIRPESVLEVQAYRYDADKPQLNEVRLRMEQGTSRSISGAATELDKSRFRLNTPIAAIGVRGTDFIVQTDATGVRATVADGAIVVGALGAGCSATALGPCNTADARLLSADMGRLMAEVRPGDRTTRVVPVSNSIAVVAATGAEERAAAMYAAENAARTAALAAAEAKGFAPMTEKDRSAAIVLLEAASFSGGGTSNPDPTTPPPIDPLPPAIPTVALNSPGDKNAQLVWGHWGYAPPPNDKISVKWNTVRDGRNETLAIDHASILLRAKDPSNPQDLLRPDTNQTVSFGLVRATASYTAGSSVEAATVSGKLSVDFGQRKFATELNLLSTSGAQGGFIVGGAIDDKGMFKSSSVSGKDTVSGALSLNGKEAGYLFTSKNAADGLFTGKTLWGR